MNARLDLGQLDQGVSASAYTAYWYGYAARQDTSKGGTYSFNQDVVPDLQLVHASQSRFEDILFFESEGSGTEPEL